MVKRKSDLFFESGLAKDGGRRTLRKWVWLRALAAPDGNPVRLGSLGGTRNDPYEVRWRPDRDLLNALPELGQLYPGISAPSSLDEAKEIVRQAYMAGAEAEAA